MPLFRKPHTVSYYEPEDMISSSEQVTQTSNSDNGSTILGQITPLSEKQSADYMLAGIDPQRLHLFLWDDGTDLIPQGRVVYGARVFRVHSAQQIYDAEPITAHRAVILEEIV